MRITDIMRKLSHPASQTFSPKVNNIKTQETASSSSVATADVNETKETAPLETTPVEEAEKIQQTQEDVITTPLSEVTVSSSSVATADVHETKETAPLETVPVEEAPKTYWRWVSGFWRRTLVTVPVEETEKIQRAPEVVITTPLSEVTVSSSSATTADVHETKETAPSETTPVAEAEKIQHAPEVVITTPLSEETASPPPDATADTYETKEATPPETIPVEEAEKIQHAPEVVITTPLSEETTPSSAAATADVHETKETAPPETVPVAGAEKIQHVGDFSDKLEEGGKLYKKASVPPPPLSHPTRGGGKTFPPPVPLREGEKGGGRRPGGGAELSHKKFPDQVRGDGIDNDTGFLQMWKAVNEFLLNASENRKADPSAVMSTAETIINSLRKNNDLVKMLFAKKQANDITSHLIDTAIVAAKIGFALGYGSGQMRELVICALVHDIGMLRVQKEVRLKKNRLSETEWTEIRKHPAYSYEMLKNKGLPPIVPEAAYQEQEREDGSGYPRGLKGESIHEYAKIIGLSAIYTAMLQPRPQRERKIPFEIIKEIIEQNKEQFPRHLIRIVIEEFSVFPVGLYVKLNTGEIARVVRTNKLTPMKPTIEALIDSHGRRFQEPKKYDMTKEPILQIVDTSFEID